MNSQQLFYSAFEYLEVIKSLSFAGIEEFLRRSYKSYKLQLDGIQATLLTIEKFSKTAFFFKKKKSLK